MFDFLKLFHQLNGTSSYFVGDIGESVFNQVAHQYLSNDYYILSNIILPAEVGTTQIDQIIISKFGIFVVEIKNYSGWIWANADGPRWTQTFPKRKYQFQNPIRQNFKHVKVLEKLLNLPLTYFHPFVAFSSKSQFKNLVPPNVVIGTDQYIEFIRTKTSILMDTKQVQNITQKILDFQLTADDHKKHINNLNQKIKIATEKNPPNCPRCGEKMFLRKAQKGNYKGKEFWGCSSYPKCEGIINKVNDQSSNSKLQELEAKLKALQNMEKLMKKLF